MHMLGTPKTMQKNPVYGNVCLEVNDFFEERITTLSAQGLNKLILDPGIGFGKRLEDNLNLLQCCDLFRQHGFPIMIGTSRKSFIGVITGRAAEDREAASLASLLMPVLKGVNILRVHDVPETLDALKMIEAIINHKSQIPNSK
jgi:dihydropteroate synthase